MKSKKAFIHVVEIVIITLVVFILVVQFSSVPRARADWERAELSALGNDIISVLDARGINWLNGTEVNHSVSQMLEGTSIMHDVTVYNAIKGNISVGCICDDREFSLLRKNLTPFTINGERVEFNVHRIPPTRISFPVVYDVIFLGDGFFSSPTSIAYVTEMKGYLKTGGGLVEIQDFTQESHVGRIQSDVFRLKYGSVSPSGTLRFTPGPGDRFYSIVKYFHRITNYTGKTYPGLYATPYSFSPSGMLGSQVKANATGMDDRLVLKDSSGAPAMIVDEGVVEGYGRTVWMAKGDANRDDRWVLIRAAIAWAAGDGYSVSPGFMASPVTFSLFKAIPESNPYSGVGMHQPIEVVLSLGYIF